MHRLSLISLTVILAVLWTATGALLAQPKQSRTPRFADYPVTGLYTGKVAEPVFDPSLHEEVRLRARDSWSEDDKPNFAGRYVRLKWSCGSACVSGALMDAETGEVIFIPFTLSDWREVHDDFEAIEVRPNSRLIVFSGARDEKGVIGMHYYVFENREFRHLRTVDTRRNFLKPPQ